MDSHGAFALADARGRVFARYTLSPKGRLHETSTHHEVQLACYGRSAHVDEKIAPLVRECWRLGIETAYSCEDVTDPFSAEGLPPPSCWLNFATGRDAAGFVQAVVAPDEPLSYDSARWPDLVKRVLWGWPDPGFWRFEGFPRRSVDAHGEARIDFGATLTFPTSDLKRVLARLRAMK